jgi:hypothetical protein
MDGWMENIEGIEGSEGGYACDIYMWDYFSKSVLSSLCRPTSRASLSRTGAIFPHKKPSAVDRAATATSRERARPQKALLGCFQPSCHATHLRSATVV